MLLFSKSKREGFNFMADKKGGKKTKNNIIMKCTECGEENYITHKNKRKHPERLELRKYCSRCQKETVHREKK